MAIEIDKKPTVDFSNMNKNKEYLSILFRGGPANRFYEYHTATFLAKIWNKTFVFDPSKTLSKGLHHDPNFEITNFFSCDIKTISTYHNEIHQFDEKDWIKRNWKDDLLDMDVPTGNVLLTKGWYQTFWDDHFTIPKLKKSEIQFDLSKAIFIHVRRGDYVRSRMFVNLVDYYKRSYGKMEQLFDDSLYLICSDDINWCKKNLEYIQNPFFLENTGYQETLWLMSQCKRGAILSNSSFSLWGAYLARINNCFDPSFKVFVPNEWTSKSDMRLYDMNRYIYPSWSEQIQV